MLGRDSMVSLRLRHRCKCMEVQECRASAWHCKGRACSLTSECANKDALANLVQEAPHWPRRDRTNRLHALPVLAGGQRPGAERPSGGRGWQLAPAHGLHLAPECGARGQRRGCVLLPACPDQLCLICEQQRQLCAACIRILSFSLVLLAMDLVPLAP